MKSVDRVYSTALAWVLALGAFAGCAAPVRTTHSFPAVALVVRLAGGGTLSPQQLTNIHKAVQGDLEAAGYQLAPNPDVADFLVTVRFTPNPLEPSEGHVVITGVEPNPMNRRRRYAEDDASPEAKERRKNMQDIERWVEMQSKASS